MTHFYLLVRLIDLLLFGFPFSTHITFFYILTSIWDMRTHCHSIHTSNQQLIFIITDPYYYPYVLNNKKGRRVIDTR